MSSTCPPIIPAGPLAAASSRGGPLANRDASTREAIAALQGEIDTDAATAAWEKALEAPDWGRPPVWLHGDLLPGNVLVEDGRVSAVIDFGSFAVGDPACDTMIAWSLFSGKSRERYRAALGVDDATWARGRGCALSQALIALPYYLNTNPVIVGTSRRAIAEVLTEG
jgi:aminoglycoside phosphotransferase (APT) family kinase protein